VAAIAAGLKAAAQTAVPVKVVATRIVLLIPGFIELSFLSGDRLKL
jgi:hypothetical protein